jgi:hypothetical protein
MSGSGSPTLPVTDLVHPVRLARHHHVEADRALLSALVHCLQQRAARRGLMRYDKDTDRVRH